MRHIGRIYSLLLKLYPRSYRAAFEAQMLQTLLDYCQEIKAAEGRVPLRRWLPLLGDELKNIGRQHWEVWLERRGSREAVAQIALSVVLFLPLYAGFYAALVKAAQTLPHPALSGIGVLIALAALILIPGFLSLAVAAALASAAERLFRRAKQVLAGTV